MSFVQDHIFSTELGLFFMHTKKFTLIAEIYVNIASQIGIYLTMLQSKSFHLISTQ